MSCFTVNRDLSSTNGPKHRTTTMVPKWNLVQLLWWHFTTLMFDHLEELCFPSIKKLDKRSNRLPDIPLCNNLERRPLCHTSSKVSGISKKTLLISNSSSNELCISCVIHNSWLMQESPDLNPDWFEPRLGYFQGKS